jgi:predicted DNA-binding protein YlxM (UPF0122 family)
MVKRRVYYSRLRKLVKDHPILSRMSVTKVTEELDISRATWYNWITAESTPFEQIPDTADKLALYFKLKRVEDLFTVEDKEVTADQQARVYQPA